MKGKIQRLNPEYPVNRKLGLDYNPEEYQELASLYLNNLHFVTESEVTKGTVVSISSQDVVINIGAKSDGLVSLSEFRDIPDLKIGDEVEVYVEEKENKKGQLVLSRKKAKLVIGWKMIQDSAINQTELSAFVKRRTKGGLIVDIEGIEAFMPGSLVDTKPVMDFNIFLEKTIPVIVIKVNPLTDNAIVSHRAVIEKGLEIQKTDIINKLEEGQILEGIVKSITDYGAFIGLGGIDGLLYITDISWRRIKHPEEILKLGQKIQVVVTHFDHKKRVFLGLKQLTKSPWETFPEHIQIGSKVKGKVVAVKEYGALLEVMPGIEGLIHVKAMSWSQYLRRMSDMLKEGDEVEAVVLTLKKEDKEMFLGVKQLTPDPWLADGIEQRYAIGTKHMATVKNLFHFGVLVELEDGMEGIVRVADLSWIKKVDHPADMLKIGDKLELVVVLLSLEKENNKLYLSLKHMQSSPWETHEADFQVSSIHTGKIVKKTDKGAFVQLSHGLEGIVPKRYLFKENGEEAALNEALEFEVIEFSKSNKRIVLAHIGSLKTSKPSFRKEVPLRHGTGNFVASDKATLGDIKELATLKKQLQDRQEASDVD